jgi:hypothetical protein
MVRTSIDAKQHANHAPVWKIKQSFSTELVYFSHLSGERDRAMQPVSLATR